jgi:hypothetical protein
MKQCPAWEIDTRSAVQKWSAFTDPEDPVTFFQKQTTAPHLIHILTPSFFKIHFNIFLQSTLRSQFRLFPSSSFQVIDKFVYIYRFLIPHTRHLFHHLNILALIILKTGIYWTIQTMSLLFSSSLYYFLSLRSQYSPRHFVPKQKQTNSVPLVCKRTIPTERPSLVGEVSANFCGYRVSRGQRSGSPRPYSRFSRLEPLLFLPSSSSIILTRLSGPRFRPTTSHKLW